MGGLNGRAPLVLSPAGLHRWTAPGSGTTYLLKVPQVGDRARFRAACAEEGARQVTLGDLVAAWRRGVEALRPDPEDVDRLRCLEVLAEYEQRLQRAAELNRQVPYDPLVDGAELARLIEPGAAVQVIADALRGSVPAVAQIEALQQSWPELAGIAGARLFLRGWESDALPPFAATLDGRPTDACLLAIPAHHLVGLGGQVQAMLQPGWATLGNSASGPGRAPEPRHSPTDGTLPESDRSSPAGT